MDFLEIIKKQLVLFGIKYSNLYYKIHICLAIHVNGIICTRSYNHN